MIAVEEERGAVRFIVELVPAAGFLGSFNGVVHVAFRRMG
jgi:hypothetical protein